MKFARSLELIQVHCQGEIGKVMVGGAPEIPGATMLDKMNHINQVDDSLRRFVTFEPRAGVADVGQPAAAADPRRTPMPASSCCRPTARIRCRAATASAW